MDVRALSLAERIGLSDAGIRRPKRAVAEERIRWWRDDAFGGDGRLMGKWLRSAGVPNMRELARLVELSGEVDDDGNAAPDVPAPPPADQKFGAEQLANGWALTGALSVPFVHWGGERIARALDEAMAAGLEVEDAVALRQQLTAHLGERVHAVAITTLALALNIARIKGELDGATPAERALSFARQLLTPERRAALFAAYPVLERRLWILTRAYVRSVGELLTHAAQDRAALEAELGVGGKLRSITLSRGDSHRGGKTVSFFTFERGRAVYKPKSLRLDRAFHDFLRWINSGVTPQLPTLTILDRDDHGWVEFIEVTEARDRDEVAEGYVRMGMLLAAMLVCRASDMHLENVVFSGGQPYIVDLETVLTPVPAFGAAEKKRRDSRNEAAWAILGIGYLPSQSGGHLDLSAAAAVADQEMSYAMPVLGGFDGDSPAMEHIKGTKRPQDNAPRLDGQLQPAADYVAELEQGFRLAYRRILDARAAFFADGGPFEAFCGAQVRWVPRATMEYGRAMINANHPGAMRDGIDQELAMARILVGPHAPARYFRILRSEVRDLWDTDVPYFTTDSSSATLYDSRGQAFPDFFEIPAAERMRQAAEAMSDHDLERNIEALRAAFAVVKTQDATLAPAAPIETGAVAQMDESELLAEAVEIGDRLLAGAAVQGDSVSWISFQPKAEALYGVAPTGPELYGGTAGVGLFLAQLAEVTGQDRFAEMAGRCRTAIRAADPMGIGAFNGAAGFLYFELRAADLLGKLDVRQARRWLGQIAREAPQDRTFDLISGSAGALIVALRALRRPALQDAAAAAVSACARRLHETAEGDGGTAKWTNQSFGVAMGGLSHGATGIALALTELAASAGGKDDLRLAKEALAFEDTLFDEATGTWRDARGGGQEAGKFPVSWCHGAPGILLGLRRMRILLGDETPAEIDRDIDRAMKIVVKSGGGGSHCLCHGAIGNLEPLLMDDAETSRQLARNLTAASIRDKRAEGRWRGGVPGYHALPGLMSGVAGIGYGLLRVADPEGVPSVLILEG